MIFALVLWEQITRTSSSKKREGKIFTGEGKGGVYLLDAADKSRARRNK